MFPQSTDLLRQREALEDLLLDEEFSTNASDLVFKKTFADVMTEQELWQWLHGPLVQAMFPEDGMILRSNVLLGTVQLRQVRTENETCTDVHSQYQQPDGGDKDSHVSYWVRKAATAHIGTTPSCFRAAEQGSSGRHESTESYGCLRDGTTPCRYNFEPPSLPPGSGGGPGPIEDSRHFSKPRLHDGHYGPGGFAQELPQNRSGAVTKLAALERDYIDASTRVLAVSFNFYNLNKDIIVAFRCVFEFDTTGHIEVSSEIEPLRLMDRPYFGGLRYVVVGGFHAVGVVLWHRRRIFGSIVDIVVRGLSRGLNWYLFQLIDSVVFFFAISRMNDYHENCLEFANDMQTHSSYWNEHYYDAHMLQRSQNDMQFWMGVSIWMGFLKVFSHLGVFRTMTSIWTVLGRAFLDLASFFLILVLICASFAAAGTIMFGDHVREFHNLRTTYWTIVYWLVGDFSTVDYEMMKKASIWAPAFIMLFLVLVVVVSVNMFIAILTGFYEEYSTERKAAGEFYIPSAPETLFAQLCSLLAPTNLFKRLSPYQQYAIEVIDVKDINEVKHGNDTLFLSTEAKRKPSLRRKRTSFEKVSWLQHWDGTSDMKGECFKPNQEYRQGDLVRIRFYRTKSAVGENLGEQLAELMLMEPGEDGDDKRETNGREIAIDMLHNNSERLRIKRHFPGALTRYILATCLQEGDELVLADKHNFRGGRVRLKFLRHKMETKQSRDALKNADSTTYDFFAICEIESILHFLSGSSLGQIQKEQPEKLDAKHVVLSIPLRLHYRMLFQLLRTFGCCRIRDRSSSAPRCTGWVFVWQRMKRRYRKHKWSCHKYLRHAGLLEDRADARGLVGWLLKMCTKESSKSVYVEQFLQARLDHAEQLAMHVDQHAVRVCRDCNAKSPSHGLDDGRKLWCEDCAKNHTDAKEIESPYKRMDIRLQDVASEIRKYNISRLSDQQGSSTDTKSSSEQSKILIDYLKGSSGDDNGEVSAGKDVNETVAMHARYYVEHYLYKSYPDAIRFEHYKNSPEEALDEKRNKHF